MGVLEKTTQPIFETKRFMLRPLRKSDAGLMSLYSSDFRVSKNLSRVPYPNPPGAVEAFIESVTGPKSDEMVWVIDATEAFGTELIGVVGLPNGGDIGYWIGHFFWGMGIATEAVAPIVDFALASGMEKVTADVFQENTASRRVLEKLGFELVGEGATYCVSQEKTVDTFQMARRKDE